MDTSPPATPFSSASAAGAANCRATNFIFGPSRTADIEQSIVMGRAGLAGCL